MPGTDKIISRLHEDCEAQCCEIEAAAVANAEKIIADAKKRAEEDAAAVKKESDEKADVLLDKAKSDAALENRRALLAAKVTMIDEIIEKAVNKLHNLDEPSYFGMLKNLALKNQENEKGVMFLSARDLQRMPEEFEKAFTEIAVSKVPADIEDGFILSYGDIEINCTFKALAASHRDELKSFTSGLLFDIR